MIETAIEIVFGLVQLVIQLVIVRLVAGHVAYSLCSKRASSNLSYARVTTVDWVVGIYAGLLWPVTVGAWVTWRLLAWLLGHVPKIGAEAAYLQAVREREHLKRADDVKMPPT